MIYSIYTLGMNDLGMNDFILVFTKDSPHLHLNFPILVFELYLNRYISDLQVGQNLSWIMILYSVKIFIFTLQVYNFTYLFLRTNFLISSRWF